MPIGRYLINMNLILFFTPHTTIKQQFPNFSLYFSTT